MINPFETIDKRLSNLESLLLDIKHSSKEIEQNFEPKNPTELLSRSEVSILLKCNLGTIHNYCKSGKLIPYGIGNRVYFKRSDIENALVCLGTKKGGQNE